MSKELKDLALEIGQFYYESRGSVDKACEDIANLGITNLSFDDDGRFVIELTRPGLLIGRKAQNIDALQKRLGVHVHIVESNSWTSLILSGVPRDEY